jgi:hypothetical protein
MPKRKIHKVTLKQHEAQFDIIAHKKEIDRLLRENAKLKAQKLTLERELELRPPYGAEPPESESLKRFREHLKKLKTNPPNTALEPMRGAP